MKIDVNCKTISGHASPQATRRYRQRFKTIVQDDFYNQTTNGLFLSSIGIGTYLGEANDEVDLSYYNSIKYALINGINVIDTAVKYRNMRSEKVISSILRSLIVEKRIEREEVFVSTKGGLLSIPEGEDRNNYIREKLVKKLGIDSDSIVDDDNCIEPVFIDSEIEKSLDNLGLETVDCYFLHNPEIMLKKYSREKFYKKLSEVFGLLEQKVDEGKINSYGLASWIGFRVKPSSLMFLQLPKIYEVARKVAGNKHHFKFIQIPLSIGMPAAFGRSQLKIAQDLGINVFTSGSVYGGKLVELTNLIKIIKQAGCDNYFCEGESLKVSLPQSSISLVQLFELLLIIKQRDIDLWDRIDNLSSYEAEGIYPKALDVVRSLPEVTTSLTSGAKPEYIRENLILSRLPKCNPSKLRTFWEDLC